VAVSAVIYRELHNAGLHHLAALFLADDAKGVLRRATTIAAPNAVTSVTPAVLTATAIAAPVIAASPAAYDAIYEETVRALLNEVRTDVGALVSDSVALRGTVAALVTDIAALRTTVDALRTTLRNASLVA